MRELIFTVKELNFYVKTLLERDENLTRVFVRGEISNLTKHGSGHIYFTIKDSEAAVKAVMFKFSAMKLNFELAAGMKIIAQGRVSVYEAAGQYQFYIDSVTPDGIGQLFLAYEQLKAKLEEEGLFASENKKYLPRYPSSVAVVTSPTGAAVRDIISIINRRMPLCKIMVFPVLVQGEGAAADIISALNLINRRQLADIIIVGRGGGSIEDLFAFNSEALARTVFASRIPVISAVGHETDFTICDFAADLRAPTPSAAAELCVRDRIDIKNEISAYKNRMGATLAANLKQKRQFAEILCTRPALRSPRIVENRRERADYLFERFSLVGKTLISRGRAKSAPLCAKLEAFSPLLALGRGYSITQTEGGATVSSIKQAFTGQRLNILLKDGNIRCVTEEITEENKL